MTVPSVRRALSLLPPCATTGIGSLPHTQQELALQMALQLDVPYLPQLPSGNPSEFMIPSALDGLPGLSFDGEGMCKVDLGAWGASREAFGMSIEVALQSGELGPFEPTAQACRSWKPFLWEVEHRKLAFAKVQLAGPGTVRWVTKTSEGGPASEHGGLDQQIFRLLLAKALAMVKAVRKAGATPILYLDEPGMFGFERANPRHLMLLQELKLLAMAAQREGALVGVHCCSNTEWGLLLELGLDLLSIDVRLSLDAVLEERAAFARFMASGATLSLGIIPTDLKSSYEVNELVESVEASLRATLPRGTSFGAVVSRMPLTPACGLAMRSVLDAERIFEQVKEAQRLLRQIAAGESQPVMSAPPN
ncbi:MAG: uroporphyrinogen decarboxylase/cobalamine-independent methonine synthase family protein [Myxococcaceae bacterium]